MFVPEHKHPLMSTRNRLHEFLVDDAFALKCSGMFRKSEKSCRYKIFRSRALCRETAQSSANRIGETRSGLSPRAAALMSGMHWKSEKTVRYTSFACLEGGDVYPISAGAQKVTDAGGALAAPLVSID